jgi:hypothetical protein
MTNLGAYAAHTRGTRLRNAALACLLLLAGGCVNILTQNAPSALQTAESRARFELNCPNVQASILSQKIVQGWRFDGAEYTVGVRGCDRQAVYVTFCRDPQDCNALSQTGRISDLQNLAP